MIKINVFMLFLILLNSIFYNNVYASIEHCYEYMYDENTDKELYKIKLNDNEEINIEGNMCIVMVNGDVIKSVLYREYEDEAVFPVRDLFEGMNYTVEWDAQMKNVIIYGDGINEHIAGGNYIILNDRAYINARGLNNIAGYRAELKNYPYIVDNDYAVFRCPILTMDNFDEDETITAERAKMSLKTDLETAFENFKNSSGYCDGSSDSVFVINEIEKSISNIQLIDEISKYRVFRGPYTIYADKVTGEMYYSIWRVHRCCIKKLDFNDPDLFVMNYFVG